MYLGLGPRIAALSDQVKIIFIGCILFLIQANAIVGSIDLPKADQVSMQSHTVVVLNAQNSSSHSRCTGTLIAKNIVLTAAHCIPESLENFWIVTSEFEFAILERHQVTKVSVHENYKNFAIPTAQQPNDDIALIQFAGPLPELYKPTDWISSFTANQDRYWLYVAGYGVSSELAFDTGELRFSKVIIENATQSFLQGNQSAGQGICKGDSGGPAYIKIENRFYVLGVVSAIVGGCKGTSYFNTTVFYDDWIQTQLKNLSQSL